MTPWCDRPVGAWFEIDTGGGVWLAGQKITPDTFATGTRAIKVSAWTKARDAGPGARGMTGFRSPRPGP